MPHGTYDRPCHVAFKQNIGHATYVRLRPNHVTHRLGYDMPHGTYGRSKPCHMVFKRNIRHATYAKLKPCHVVHGLSLSHPTWHLSTA
jgi:hypothetical protein